LVFQEQKGFRLLYAGTHSRPMGPAAGRQG